MILNEILRFKQEFSSVAQLSIQQAQYSASQTSQNISLGERLWKVKVVAAVSGDFASIGVRFMRSGR